jgi:DNA-binding NarL/FixJ family response regulator
MEIIALLCMGFSNKEVGKIAHISKVTVSRHLKVIYDLTGVGSRLELALWAAHHGISGGDQWP